MKKSAENEGKLAGYSVRVWITREDVELFQELSKLTGLSQTELQTRVLHAGIHALTGRAFITLPLSFTVKEPPKQEPK